MGWASGEYSQAVTDACAVAAPRMSSWTGWDCQKLRTPMPKPPRGSLSEQNPSARVPPEIPTQPWPSPVRLRSSKPSALSWLRV